MFYGETAKPFKCCRYKGIRMVEKERVLPSNDLKSDLIFKTY